MAGFAQVAYAEAEGDEVRVALSRCSVPSHIATVWSGFAAIDCESAAFSLASSLEIEEERGNGCMRHDQLHARGRGASRAFKRGLAMLVLIGALVAGGVVACSFEGGNAALRSCVLYKTGANVRLTIWATNPSGGCQELAEELSSDGGFWTKQAHGSTSQLQDTCEMRKSHTIVVVSDSGTAFFGTAICSELLQSGWNEDTTDKVGSAASATNRQIARRQAAQKLLETYDAAVSARTALSSDTEALVGDVTASKSDLDGVHADAAATAKATHWSICPDADGVSADYSGIQTDIDGVASDMESIHSDLVTLDTDLNELSGQQAKTPAGTTPSADQVKSLLGQASAGERQDIAQANDSIRRMNAYQNAAYSADVRAQKRGDCGDIGAAPRTLAQLTLP